MCSTTAILYRAITAQENTTMSDLNLSEGASRIIDAMLSHELVEQANAVLSWYCVANGKREYTKCCFGSPDFWVTEELPTKDLPALALALLAKAV